MTNYQYYQPGASLSGCPGTALTGGWYEYGSSTPVQTSYINPATGSPYTPIELGGGTPTDPTTPTGTPTGTPPETVTGAPAPPTDPTEPAYHWNPETGEWVTDVEQLPVGGEYPHEGAPTDPLRPDATTALPTVTAPEVTPAPPYEITPEQQAFEDMYSGQLTDWVEAGGYGIPAETQAQMIQQQTDALKAREQESLRVMKNTMERRGLTNTGLIFANEQAIRSGTSKAIAGAIADVQIKSALMKLASFETAMGQAGQFLNYLSTQSQLAYQPQFATWQAQQMANMQSWQAEIDFMKMELNQAYQTQNLTLQAQLQSQLDAQQHQYDVQLMEMEIEANQKAAAAEGWGGLLGTIFGWLFSWL